MILQLRIPNTNQMEMYVKVVKAKLGCVNLKAGGLCLHT